MITGSADIVLADMAMSCAIFADGTFPACMSFLNFVMCLIAEPAGVPIVKMSSLHLTIVPA